MNAKTSLKQVAQSHRGTEKVGIYSSVFMCAQKKRSKSGFPVVVGSLTLNLLCATRYASRMKEIELYGERRDDCSVIRHGDIDRRGRATTVYLRATACKRIHDPAPSRICWRMSVTNAITENRAVSAWPISQRRR